MRISSPERLLREIASDPRATPKQRTDALLAMDRPSVEFLTRLLRAGKSPSKRLPASVVITATVLLKTTRAINKSRALSRAAASESPTKILDL